MILRGPFAVPAGLEDLAIELASENPRALRMERFHSIGCNRCSSRHHRSSVAEQMVSEQMVFEMLGQKAHLARDTCGQLRAERWSDVAGEAPVQDAAGDWIRFPSVAVRRRTCRHPRPNEFACMFEPIPAPVCRRSECDGNELRVVLAFVPPQFGEPRSRPIVARAMHGKMLDLALRPEVGDCARSRIDRERRHRRRMDVEYGATDQPCHCPRPDLVELQPPYVYQPPADLGGTQVSHSPVELSEFHTRLRTVKRSVCAGRR